MSDLVKQEKFKKNAKTVMAASLCLVAAPAAVFVAGSVWVTGIAAGSILVGVALMPAASQWITNLKFRALDAVIKGDPIAAAWGLHSKEGEELREMRNLIQSQISEVENLRLMLNDLAKELGEAVDEDRAAQIKEMEQMVNYRMQQYNEACDLHAKDGLELRKAEATYKFDKSMAAVSSKVNMGDDWQSKFTKERINSHLMKARADSIASLRMSMSVKNFQDFKKAQDKGQLKAKEVDTIEYDASGHMVTQLAQVKVTQPAS